MQHFKENKVKERDLNNIDRFYLICVIYKPELIDKT
jgi:hypothetical protein